MVSGFWALILYMMSRASVIPGLSIHHGPKKGKGNRMTKNRPPTLDLGSFSPLVRLRPECRKMKSLYDKADGDKKGEVRLMEHLPNEDLATRINIRDYYSC